MLLFISHLACCCGQMQEGYSKEKSKENRIYMIHFSPSAAVLLQQIPRLRESDVQEKQMVWLLLLPHQEMCPWWVDTAGKGCLHHMAGRLCVRSQCPLGCRRVAQAHPYTLGHSCKYTQSSQALHRAGHLASLNASMQHRYHCAHPAMTVDTPSPCTCHGVERTKLQTRGYHS